LLPIPHPLIDFGQNVLRADWRHLNAKISTDFKDLSIQHDLQMIDGTRATPGLFEDCNFAT
jgi:hypothetical protein